MYILGISAYYHDSAACLIKDGEILSAAQEERFTRKKHDFAFPSKAVEFCLKQNNITANELEHIAFYDKPLTKFNRIIESYLQYPGRGLRSFLKAMPLWLKQKLWIPDLIRKELNYEGEVLFPEHHESHAASAYYPSPFEKAAFLTIDGVGEWATASYGVGKGNKIKILCELHYPHSLGLLYSAFTYYTGFKVNSGEYKIMGLAPYGEPKYVDLIYDKLIDLKEDGSFYMNQEYFNYSAGLTMTNSKFDNLFGGPPRKPESRLTQKEMDLARSVQEVTEEIVLRMAKNVKEQTEESNLCLAGGVALNCVANGKLLREKVFDKIWIQPAAGDAGGALGAALATYYNHLDKPLIEKNGWDVQKGSLLGSEYSDDEIRSFLVEYKIPHKYLNENELLEEVARSIINGDVIGWFNGKMEFGPRALGSRSIIGDARSPDMQKRMNLKIKFRESFRPFAPSVLEDKVREWFEIDRESPYMLLVAEVKKEKQRSMADDAKQLWGIDKLNIVRSEVPAITHVDYTARIQTVNKRDNLKYYNLISRFYEKTGCPLIVNTSFNVRGEPIVESPLDAYKCFMRTEMDKLVLGNFLLYKNEQPEFRDDINWKEKYELD